MSRINELNKRLLIVLGLSSDSAQIVIERIEELQNEAGQLRTENICLKQDLADAKIENARLLADSLQNVAYEPTRQKTTDSNQT